MGSFSILNNISAVNGQHMLNLNNINLNRTLQRMSSGMRINTGADDAAGLQIADALRANVSALNQAIRNASDGISFLQIADGALGEITNMLTRMVVLAEEAANEPIDENGRKALNNEFQELQQEIARLALQTNFNGTKLFDTNRVFGKTLDLFVGDISGPSSISVVMGYVQVVKVLTSEIDANPDGPYDPDAVYKYNPTTQEWENASNVALDPATDEVVLKIANFYRGEPIVGDEVGLDTVNLLTHGNAADALGKIRLSLNEVSNMRGAIGAGLNRLQAGISVMQTQSRNTLAAESQIRDANMAEEITNMTKYQILAQTGIAALAHSNSNSQLVLSLLQ